MSDAVGMPRFRAGVRFRRELSPNVVAIGLAYREPRPSWIPGQYLLLSSADAPELDTPFSIASAPDPARPGELELAVSKLGNAGLLAKLEPGNEVFASAPRGAFLWRPSAGATLLIGIGTGLAPLRAMLQAALAGASSGPVVLLAGARSEPDMLWREEFEALARAHPRFRFEPTLSRPGPDFRGRLGRVQQHLDVIAGSLANPDVYVCGNRPMVGDCVVRLTGALGIDPTRVFSEAF